RGSSSMTPGGVRGLIKVVSGRCGGKTHSLAVRAAGTAPSTFRGQQKTGTGPVFRFANFGRGDRMRTCDLYVPNVALYQAELHPDGEPLIVVGNPWRGKRWDAHQV